MESYGSLITEFRSGNISKKMLSCLQLCESFKKMILCALQRCGRSIIKIHKKVATDRCGCCILLERIQCIFVDVRVSEIFAFYVMLITLQNKLC